MWKKKRVERWKTYCERSVLCVQQQPTRTTTKYGFLLVRFASSFLSSYSSSFCYYSLLPLTAQHRKKTTTSTRVREEKKKKNYFCYGLSTLPAATKSFSFFFLPSSLESSDVFVVVAFFHDFACFGFWDAFRFCLYLRLSIFFSVASWKLNCEDVLTRKGKNSLKTHYISLTEAHNNNISPNQDLFYKQKYFC